MIEQIQQHIRMMRIGDWIRFYLLAPLAGALIVNAGFQLIVLVLLIYFCLIGYAFAVNNYFDVEIDRLHPGKVRSCKNPLASGLIGRNGALMTLGSLAIAALVLSSLGKWPGTAIVGLNLILVTAYSGMGLRLKERPGFDIVSHGMMFGTLPLLAGAAVATGTLDQEIVYPSLVAFLVGCEALVAHQVLDFHIDRDATRTTATAIGQQRSFALLGILALSSVAVLKAMHEDVISTWAAAILGAWLLVYPIYSCRSVLNDIGRGAGAQ